jgi:hypothetical protein
MKPRKSGQSTPAGVPHLQEVGYTVTYEDVLVTTEYLNLLRRAIKRFVAQRNLRRKVTKEWEMQLISSVRYVEVRT